MFPPWKLDDGCGVNRLVAMPVTSLLCGVCCCVFVLNEIEEFVIWVSVGLRA